ncbi:hypothetical protein B0H14DRAFT_3455688 [Mycena olivaceomarginata]|nr:hypothetical protein B0H14DRAFT_3455688 [Mycena olivaceomarginata]
MEIGSPMASMYLLGNPDHYTSHQYVPFAWRPYVQFVRSHWITDLQVNEEIGDKDDEERIPIGRLEGKFVPASSVDDYRYRPQIYENVTLFEWVQCSIKKKRTANERAAFEEELKLTKYLHADYHRAAMKRLEEEGEYLYEEEGLFEDEPEVDGEFLGLPYENEDAENTLADDDMSDWETDDEDDTILEKETILGRTRKPRRHAFLPKHPLFPSHSVTCDFERLHTVIPNFIGGSIPRSDKGDRAAYCMTILMLFKAWRSPCDLKDTLSTWDQAFQEHEFTTRQKELIKNFDVRYECNDAKDDYFAQMKKKLADARKAGQDLFPTGFLSHKDKFAEDLNDFDYGSDDEDLVDNDEDTEKGKRTLRNDC